MTLYIDVKYASMLGPRLRNFKRKNEYLWNFSCPVCGDSSKNKTKARGYVYKVKTGLFVKCHNCGYGTTVGGLIKYVDPLLYEQYTLENYKESGAPRSHHKDPEIAIPEIISQARPPTNALGSIKSLDSLRPDHPAVQYALKRKIPSRFLSLLYFAPRFKQFVNTVVPGKFNIEIAEHPRLIIPYFNKQGEFFAFQGRAFGKESPKYYTIKLDEGQERIYGVDRLNFSKRIYITEGPLDSLFIPNAIAVSGSSFNGPFIESLKDDATVIFDREPRSVELCNLIKKSIDRGFSVCLWPDSIKYKDINEMIIGGYSSEQLVDIIDQNTFSGAEAQLRFSMWRKCE